MALPWGICAPIALRGTHCTTAEIVSAVAGEVLQSRTKKRRRAEKSRPVIAILMVCNDIRVEQRFRYNFLLRVNVERLLKTCFKKHRRLFKLPQREGGHGDFLASSRRIGCPRTIWDLCSRNNGLLRSSKNNGVRVLTTVRHFRTMQWIWWNLHFATKLSVQPRWRISMQYWLNNKQLISFIPGPRRWHSGAEVLFRYVRCSRSCLFFRIIARRRAKATLFPANGTNPAGALAAQAMSV